MSINFNFRFKKYYKYFFLVILCYLLFKSFNVGATGTFLDNNVNISTPNNIELSELLYNGDSNDLNTYFVENYNDNNFLTYVDNFKSKVATQLGYSNFDLLTNDYYFIIQYMYRPNYFNGSLLTNIFLYNKNDIDSNLFVPYLSIETKNNVSILNANTSYNITIRPNAWQNAFSNSIYSIPEDSFPSSFNLNNGVSNHNFTCSRNSSYCNTTFDSSSLTPTLNIAGFLNKDTFVWYDTNNENFNFKFGTHNFNSSASNVYFFQYLKINNSTKIYNIQDVIGYVDFTIIETPNISDLGNNSFGINFNAIDNIYLDYTNNSSTTINCPNDRNFVGNVCYLYSSDFSNFDISNTNVSNSAVWYIGNTNVLSLDSSKYYILTFRLYTPYNLDILTTIYNFTNDTTDYTFNIIDKYYKDYTLYKDYSIVFQPTHNGIGYLQYIDIVFKTLNNFTNELNKDYSFGIHKSLKLSQFDNLPTSTDVENNFTNDTLDSISNINVDSFFTDFNVNDRGLSQIVLLPLNFISNFKNQSCSSILLPIPHIDNVYLPCVSSFMESNFSSLWSLYKILFNGILIYKILISLFADIKDLYRPDNDRIEVLEL